MSLLEALVTLAILSVVMGVSVSRVQTPSGLHFKRAAADLIAKAQLLRRQAILSGQPQILLSPNTSCTGSTESITFYADGTASGQGYCLSKNTQKQFLTLDRLTGRLNMAGAP